MGIIIRLVLNVTVAESTDIVLIVYTPHWIPLRGGIDVMTLPFDEFKLTLQL